MINKDGFFIRNGNNVFFVDGITGSLQVIYKDPNTSASMTYIGALHGRSSFLANKLADERYFFNGKEQATVANMQQTGNTTLVNDVIASDDGTIYALLKEDTVYIYSNVDDTILFTKPLSSNNIGGKLAISPDNAWVAVAQHQVNTKIYEIDGSGEIQLGTIHPLSIAWNTTGDYILSTGLNAIEIYDWDGSTATLHSSKAVTNTAQYSRGSWDNNDNVYSAETTGPTKKYDITLNATTLPVSKYNDEVLIVNKKTNSAVMYKNGSGGGESAYFIPDIDNFTENDMIPLYTDIGDATVYYGNPKYKVEGTFTDNSEETDFKVTIYDIKGDIIAEKTLPTGANTFSIEVPTPHTVKAMISGIPNKHHQTEYDYELKSVLHRAKVYAHRTGLSRRRCLPRCVRYVPQRRAW